MSYILDALKKSDKERKQSQKKTLDSVLTHDDHTGQKHSTVTPTKLYRFLFFLLFSVSAATVWIGLIYIPKKPVDNSQDNKVTLHSAPAPTVKKEIPPAKEQVTVTNQRITYSQPLSEKEPETAQTPPTLLSPHLPLLEELPKTTREKIPELEFAGHVYSDLPQQRLIMINHRIVREGDSLEANLRLEEITNSGVILRYEDIRFQKILF